MQKNVTSYSEEAIEDVMLACDNNILREVFSTEDILSRS